MHQLNAEMKSCIDECQRCYQMCLSTAMGHCLEAGGQHTEPKHFRLMIACAEMCRTASAFCEAAPRAKLIKPLNMDQTFRRMGTESFKPFGDKGYRSHLCASIAGLGSVPL